MESDQQARKSVRILTSRSLANCFLVPVEDVKEPDEIEETLRYKIQIHSLETKLQAGSSEPIVYDKMNATSSVQF